MIKGILIAFVLSICFFWVPLAIVLCLAFGDA